MALNMKSFSFKTVLPAILLLFSLTATAITPDTLIVIGSVHASGDRNTSDYLSRILSYTGGNVIFPEERMILEIDSIIKGVPNVQFNFKRCPLSMGVTLLNSASVINWRDTSFSNKKGVWTIIQFPNYINVVSDLKHTPFHDRVKATFDDYDKKIRGWIDTLNHGTGDGIKFLVRNIDNATYTNPSPYVRVIDFRLMPHLLNLTSSSNTAVDTSVMFIDYVDAPGERLESVQNVPVSDYAFNYIYSWFSNVNHFELITRNREQNSDSLKIWWQSLIEPRNDTLIHFYQRAEVLHLSEGGVKPPELIWTNGWMDEQWNALLYPVIYPETFNEGSSASWFFRSNGNSVLRYNDYEKIHFYRKKDNAFDYDSLITLPRGKTCRNIYTMEPLNDKDWLTIWIKNRKFSAQLLENSCWTDMPKRIIKISKKVYFTPFVPSAKMFGDKIFLAWLNKYDIYLYSYDKKLKLNDTLKVSQTQNSYCCISPVYLKILKSDSAMMIYWGSGEKLWFRMFDSNGKPFSSEVKLNGRINTFGQGSSFSNHFFIVYTENINSAELFKVAVISRDGTVVKILNAGMHDRKVNYNLISKIVGNELHILYRGMSEKKITYRLRVPIDELISETKTE
jgi:hypothetical protein